MSEPKPILEARGLVKRYGQVVALDGADFELYPNEIVAIIGDNGAGKSTLIKALSGALQPDEGEIRLDGKQVHFRSPRRARSRRRRSRAPCASGCSTAAQPRDCRRRRTASGPTPARS